MGKLRDLRLFFYKHNPVELTDKERKIEGKLPNKSEVENDGVPPMSASEIREWGAREMNTSKNNVYNKLTSLQEKKVVKKMAGGYVSSGSSKLVLNSTRVSGAMLFLSFALLFVGALFLRRSFSIIGVIMAIFAILFWKR